MENHYFKTAEFAALCGVRKDTLLHYDHIGLLKPQWVGENGYRYYAAQQLRTYDLIAALRRLGPPLAEIRDYLTRRSPQALLALLEEKEAQLAEERRRLEAVSRLLQTAMDTTRLAQQVQPGEIRLEELPPAHCAVVEAPDFTGGKFEEARYLLHIRQLLAKTFALNAIVFCQHRPDRLFQGFIDLPQVRVQGVSPRCRIRHIKDIVQARVSAGFIQQRNALGTTPDVTVHAPADKITVSLPIAILAVCRTENFCISSPD